MKHISLRVDDKDYEFIRALSKKKKVRESNLFREVLHDFVLRSTGQTSLGELESSFHKMADELRDLETRIARIEGLTFTASSISTSLPLPSSTQKNDSEIRSELDESRISVEIDQLGKSSRAKVTPAYNQAIGEIVRQLAGQKESKIENEFMRHCVSAAESAVNVHDYPQATKYYRIALELSREDMAAEARSVISEKIGDLEYLTGENDLALKYWNDALGRLAKMDDERKSRFSSANIYRKIGLLYVNGVYDREKGLSAFQTGLKLLDESEDSPEIAALYESIARLYWRTGEDLEKAEEFCRRALRIAERLSLHEVEANAHQTLAFLLPITRKGEILEHFQKSLKISIEHGCFEVTSRAYNNLGYVCIALGGNMKKSVQFYLEGLRFSRRTQHAVLYTYTKLALSLYAYIPTGEWAKAQESVNEFLPELSMQHPHRFASAFQILGQASFNRGEYGNAQEYFNAYLPVAIKAKEIQAIIPCYVSLGNLYFEKLDLARAEEYLRLALEMCRQIGLRFDNCMRYANCLSLLSRVCSKQGRSSEAASLVSELSSISKSIDEDWAYGHYYRALGALQASEGRYSEAIRAFGESIEKWRRLSWPFEVACDCYELGLAYLMTGEREKALQQVDHSIGIFTALGAKGHLERAAAKKKAVAASFGSTTLAGSHASKEIEPLSLWEGTKNT